MKTIIKSGKHSVLVLATEGKYVTVQLKNGEIHSFATEYDFSLFKDFLANTVIDIIVKGRGRNKEISLADNTIKNIVNDEALVELIAEETFVDEILAEYEEASSLSFNRTCELAEDRIREGAKKEKIHIEATKKYLLQIGKGITDKHFACLDVDFEASVFFLAGKSALPLALDVIFNIMVEEALDGLTEERIKSVCAISLIDSELIPIAQQQRDENMKEIKERIARMSNTSFEFEKLAPTNIIAKIGMVTENPILVVAENGEKFEIDTQRMTPEAYWCLLVEKSFNEQCNFLLYDDGNVVPNTKLEKTQMPKEARDEMNIIAEHQKQLVSLYAITREKRREILEISGEIFALSASERTSDENQSYSSKKYEKARLKKELASFEKEIDDKEVIVADLKIHWQKKIGK